MESSQLAKRLTKKELRTATCCRLCAAQPSSNNPLGSSIVFLPLYELREQLLDKVKINLRLAELVNAYLPLKVNEEDKNYPTSICSGCYYTLLDIVPFFDKMKKGQRMLADILNKNKEFDMLVYGESNVMRNVARRVGRPRKDPNAPKKEIPQKDPFVLMERITEKRIRKPPVRFSETVAMTDLDEDHKTRGKENARVQVPSVETTKKRDVESVGFPRDLTSVPNSFNLDVLMDGDEEVVEENPVATQDADIRQDLSLGLLPGSTVDPGNDLHVDLDMSDYEDERRKPRTKKKRGRGRPKKLGFTTHSEKFPCLSYPPCKKIYRDPRSLKYHQERVHQVMPTTATCHSCDKGFSHPHLLKLHLQSVHSAERKYKCHVCLERFKTSSTLHTHMNRHRPPGFKCDQENCGQMFTLKSSLKSHMLLHSGTRPFQCRHCSKSCAQQSNLVAHERTHTNSRPFKCSHNGCDKGFKTSTQLNQHAATHAKTKNHLCPICGKSFATETTFKHHTMSHEGTRPYECQVCKKRFTTGINLKKHSHIHARNVETADETRYVCYCGHEVQTRRLLEKHQKSCPIEVIPVTQDEGTTQGQMVEETIFLSTEDVGGDDDYAFSVVENYTGDQIEVTSEAPPEDTEEHQKMFQLVLTDEFGQQVEEGEAPVYYIAQLGSLAGTEDVGFAIDFVPVTFTEVSSEDQESKVSFQVAPEEGEQDNGGVYVDSHQTDLVLASSAQQ